MVISYKQLEKNFLYIIRNYPREYNLIFCLCHLGSNNTNFNKRSKTSYPVLSVHKNAHDSAKKIICVNN